MIFTEFKDKAKSAANKAKKAVNGFAVKTSAVVSSVRGENFIDSGVKILIAVVIGALLLAGLYALFGDTILPTLTEKVEDMFDFAG